MRLRQVSGGESRLFHPRSDLLFEFIETAPQRAGYERCFGLAEEAERPGPGMN
jgi:hypothetical protein